MDRFFAKLQPEKLVLRNNYFFQVVDPSLKEPVAMKDVDPEELHWSSSTLGNEGPLSRALLVRSPADNQRQIPSPMVNTQNSLQAPIAPGQRTSTSDPNVNRYAAFLEPALFYSRFERTTNP